MPLATDVRVTRRRTGDFAVASAPCPVPDRLAGRAELCGINSGAVVWVDYDSLGGDRIHSGCIECEDGSSEPLERRIDGAPRVLNEPPERPKLGTIAVTYAGIHNGEIVYVRIAFDAFHDHTRDVWIRRRNDTQWSRLARHRE